MEWRGQKEIRVCALSKKSRQKWIRRETDALIRPFQYTTNGGDPGPKPHDLK